MQSTMWRFILVFLGLAAFPATPADVTFTVTGGMPVTIEIVGSCTVSATDLNFGAYISNSPTPVQGQTTITLNCSTGTVEVFLDAGTGPGRNTHRRTMSKDPGVDRLEYDLYQDAGRQVHWGDESGTNTRDVLTTGSPQTITVYGQIPAGQRVRDGTYSDMITVTVQF